MILTNLQTFVQSSILVNQFKVKEIEEVYILFPIWQWEINMLLQYSLKKLISCQKNYNLLKKIKQVEQNQIN